MNFNRFRVKSGAKVDLDKRDPADKTGVPAAKEERLQRLTELAKQVDALQDLLYAEHRHKVLIVLQGMDTSGKDGTIRHVFTEVDPLGVRAVSFRAPVGEELEHTYLWRIHRQTPGKGEIVIFNRSHYEDVLVPRVHAMIDLAECKRRYRQINDFERMLAENGTILLKFFLHISKSEQRTRLQERIDEPNKRWKFNPRDLKERTRWNDYKAAYENAIEATSSEWAPWYVVPSNSKSTRNLIVSSVLVETLEGLKMAYPQPAEDYSGIVVE
ncbi:MAG TPA: polyphosphate kinase 2 family protein [Burkholderiales bacterium]|jgi:PPK2 family polyphosphate:nucleotide phosphotransferase